MNKKKAGAWVGALLLVAVIGVGGLTGAVLGKYFYQKKFSGTIKISAHLAETMTLTESKAERQPDGSYTLDTGVRVDGNSYVLLPGTTIPKDPVINITGKTPIEAYLFIEVVDTTSGALDVDLADHWIDTSLRAPQKTGGKVYVYSEDGSNPKAIVQNLTVAVLEENQIFVSQSLLDAGEPGTLEIYAYLEQTDIFAN